MKDSYLQFITSNYSDIIVCPSYSFDLDELNVAGVDRYDERALYHLFLLRNNNIRLIFVTTYQFPKSTLGKSLQRCAKAKLSDYYFNLFGVKQEECVDRVFFFHTPNPARKWLSQKILDDENLMESIISKIRDPNRACLVAIHGHFIEEMLAKRLGVRLIGCNSYLSYFDTKYGAKSIFVESSVQTPDYTNLVYTEEELFQEILKLHKRHKDITKFVIKLNASFAGCGVGVWDVSNFISLNENEETLMKLFKENTKNIKLIRRKWEEFYNCMKVVGAIAEVFIPHISSPSGQAFIDIKGNVHLLATHDQILSKQDEYKGSTCPANEKYRKKIEEYTCKIGKTLSKNGVRYFFGADYIATESGDLYAIELNVRQLGNTHSSLIVKVLTDGEYKSGLIVDGKEKFYLINAFSKKELQKVIKEDIIKKCEFLRYNEKTKKGIILQALDLVEQKGKIGMICIGDSREEIEKMYTDAKHFITHKIVKH